MRYLILLFLILLANQLPAQRNITGTWEGELGSDQFLQLNIVQNGDQLCGYTWDYVKRDRRSNCKAYFKATYDKKRGKWIFEGTSFIDNSGGHYLMRMNLGNHVANGEEVLEGVCTARSFLLNLLGGSNAPEYIYLKKVSSKPTRMYERMKDCFPEKKDTVAEIKKDTVVIAKAPPKKDSVAKPVIKPKPVDTVAVVSPPVKKDSVVIAKKDSVNIPKLVTARKNKEQSRLEVNVKSITLNVYDNAIVDGDTVSIYYNGKLLISHRRLSERPIEIKLELDETQSRHEIIMFAENLGSIPPNTALIVVYAGSKRYELFSSASLEENAVLVFDYKPK
jgi:hypothetical protein